MNDRYFELKSQAMSTGDKGFCVPLAYSAVTNLDFHEVNSKMLTLGVRKKGQGTYQRDWEPFGRNVLQLDMEDITTELRAKAKTVRTAARVLRKGKFLIKVRGHLLAIVDGEVMDWTAGRQHRIQQAWRVTTKVQAAEPVSAPVAPVQPAQPAPMPVPTPKPKRNVRAAAEALRADLIHAYEFSEFQLGFSGKFIKFNGLNGAAYLSPNKNGVRFFVRNPDDLVYIERVMITAGFGMGQRTAKYTFWMLTLTELESIKDLV